jgi:hypothetical protein
MAQQHGFSLTVSQNRYLSTEDDEMHAVLTVTAGGTDAATAGGLEVAEVIAIDCSGSMSFPPKKIAAAQRATRTAIDTLRDGALFAVIEGTHVARVVYPPSRKLVAATPQTRREAKRAVAGLRADGGTSIGTWLRHARELLTEHPTAVRHVIMLTDGKNNQTEEEINGELAACAPVFTCDSRGIGEDWEPRQLLRIAAALHGTADAVEEPADLAEAFASMTRSAMAKVVSEVRILVQTTAFAKVDFLRQTYPTESDLDGQPAGPRGTAFSTGSWGVEDREFHLRLRVDSAAGEPDTDIRIARVDVQLRRPGSTEFERACEPALVFAHWTDDLKLSSIIDAKVAHYTDQTELGQAVLSGCDAHDAGDLDTAAVEWGRAVALATRLGNEKVLGRLLRLVEVVGDPGEGVVRIKPSVRAVDLLSAAMGSVVSSMSPDADPAPGPERAPASGPELSCAVCEKVWPAGSVFCGGCGNRLSA